MSEMYPVNVPQQSRSLLASGRSPPFPTLAQRCGERASRTPHIMPDRVTAIKRVGF